MKYLAILLALLSAPAHAQGGSGVDKWLDAFATRDSLAQLVVFQRFEKEVPAADRAATLVSLWDAAAKEKERRRDLIRESIVGYVATRSTTELPWTGPLRQLVKNATGEKSAEVRATALTAISKRGAATEMRDEVVRSLDDSDEMVRDRAIDEVGRWPDHAQVLGDYVRRYQDKKAHTATVARAKLLIKKGGIK